jgi:hypothetical protein
MDPVPCPSCHSQLTLEQLDDGWCENCGKQIPPYVLHQVPNLSQELRALHKSKSGSGTNLRKRHCFFCGQQTEAKLYYVRFLQIAQSFIPGVVVTTSRTWVDVRCFGCARCVDRLTLVKMWTMTLMLVAAALPLLACLLIYLPMQSYIETHRSDPGSRPGGWVSVTSALFGLVLPFVLALVGVFGGFYLRRRMFARQLEPDALLTVHDRLGIKRIHDISFREEPHRGSHPVDLAGG